MPIHFGTDGWRAVISDTFTFDNLRIVAQAIADSVASDHWDKNGNGGEKPDPKKIVVGFDTRFLSDRFAGEVARVLAANGFTVLLAQSDAPTPDVYRLDGADGTRGWRELFRRCHRLQQRSRG